MVIELQAVDTIPLVCWPRTDSYQGLVCRNYKKVRERCRKGIPPSCRARAWLHLCGAKFRMESAAAPGTWRRLTQARGDARCTEDIEKDLHRNFPTHELFGGEYEKIGRAELYKVNGESTFFTIYILPTIYNIYRC